MSRKNKDLINKIENLEQLLRELKLELTEDTQSTGVPKVGDKVKIKNPSRGQPRQGVILKIHPTKRATVLGTDGRGKEIKIIRLLKNLEKSQNDS